MDEYKVVGAMSKGDEAVQDVEQDYVVELSLLETLSKEQLSLERGIGSPEKPDVPEFVVEVENSSHLDSRQPSYHDGAKSCYETPMWSSCSQATFQGGVSLSVGEGTVSSDGHQAFLLQQDGAFTGGSHEDGSSGSSFGEPPNMFSHGQGFHDGDFAGCARLPHESAFGTEYFDDGGAHVVLDPKSENVAECEDCLESTHLLEPEVCDDEEGYSGHASDPGFYAREALKMSPGACFLDGSMSPPMGANESTSLQAEKLSNEAGDEGLLPQAPYPSQDVSYDDIDSSFNRVTEWINSIQSSEVDLGVEDEDLNRGSSSAEIAHTESSEALAALQLTDLASVNNLLGSTAVRSLHPASTVAHLSGIGLREVPSLGIFSSLRSLNLSANLIVHVPVGCLPRSLHSLDLSRNRIAQIEGFRELTRLRVLNVSYNRITRIGHGLANCTLIKELYLAGNKIAEVEGLHRLLKLAVLDLSFNKVTTSKALGQLAANYGSLLALNLLGNPILTNFSEDQIRKLVTALTPHVAYLNRQPIKAISVREAALDSVARAALGTPQRHSKSRDIKAGRKTPGAMMSAVKKKPPPHQHARHLDKRVAVPSVSSSGQNHYHHGKGSGRAQGASLLGGSQNIVFDEEMRSMHRSRSAGVLQDQSQ